MWLYVYESMASPQLENGYTKIANKILEAIAQTSLSDYESRIIHILWRKTYGYNKKEDWISLSQFCLKTNIKRSHVCKTIRRLKQRNIIIKGGTIWKPLYKFQKDFEQWGERHKTVLSSPRMETSPASPHRGNALVPIEVIQLVPIQAHTKESITKETFTKTPLKKNLSIIDNVTPLLTWGESRRGRKYAQPIKQRKHIESMLKVGWTPQEIQEKYEFLEEDKYWGDRGIDFAIVSSQLDKEKTKQGESLLWDN